MKYIEFLDRLQKSGHFIFSLQDLLVLFPKTKKKTVLNQLSEWCKKGYTIRLKKSLYEIAQKGAISEFKIPDLFVANKLYVPSYVSLETALSIYNMIPEVAIGVTSVTTNPTKRFKNKHGRFWYFSCKPDAYTGYLLTDYEGFQVAIAEKEKALVDFIYYKTRREKNFILEEERLDEDILKELNWEKVIRYAKLYNKRLTEKIREIKRAL